LGIDLDGTLVRGGSVDRVDVDAVRDASARGIAIVLATGRLSSGALVVAGELGIETPVVCADGGLIACARDGTALERTGIEAEVAMRVLRALTRHRLAPFVLLDDAVCCGPEGRALASSLVGWSGRVVESPRLETVVARSDRQAVIVLGVGRRDHAEAAYGRLQRRFGKRVALSAFGLGDDRRWAIRVQSTRASKGSAIVRVADRLGCDVRDSAAIGDWYNDVSMFEAVGRSFAMGHAPDVVRRAATDVLAATERTGGGVVEALARWLDVPASR
jgi:hydroxymethylpyrimidine pyrophosphatase-like HAD family hydrolase